ncbi:MAG: hypothetical protein K8R02_08770 [Anaerohalosphaeraceae bacterium]|nr:hypothetical protein [Anaerohalosphaeraceae bacterium]
MEPTWEVVDMKKFRPLIIAAVVLVVLAVLAASSITYIGGDDVGIVEKKFGGGSLEEGRILAANGENGIQAQILMPGVKLFYWSFWKKVTKVPLVEIKEGFVGLVQTTDGKPLPEGVIYSPEWKDFDRMIDAAYFLGEGKGYKGQQLTVLRPGNYRLNTELFKVKIVPLTNVEAGYVAVIKSNVGPLSTTGSRLVKKGERGIWDKPLPEAQYYLHTEAYKVTMMSIRQTKVSYTAEAERGESGRSQPMRPITVRSSDGFTFPVDVRMNYLIKPEDAPTVVANIGDGELVLDKLVSPTVRAVFRNNAEKIKAIKYVQNRSVQEEQSAEMLRKALQKDGVTVLAVRIGDVGNEKTLGELLKTQTDREIAFQEEETFKVQQKAAEMEKTLTKTTQEAEEEKRLATAAYGVKVAEEEKKQMIIDAQAQAEKIALIAQAQAAAYKKIAEVIGQNNAALIEIMKLVAADKISITPEVMVGAGGGSGDALMGTMLRGMLNKTSGSK